MKKRRETACLLGPQEKRYFATKEPSPLVLTHRLKLLAEMMRAWSLRRVFPPAVKQGSWACGGGGLLIKLLNPRAPGLLIDFQNAQLGGENMLSWE